MSSGVAYFSSPLESHYSSMQSRTTFWTPQQQKSTQYTPSSPSPLQTSRMINLMSNPFTTKLEEIKDSTTKQEVFSSESNDSKPLFFLNQQPSTHQSVDAARTTQFQFESRARSSSPSVQLQNQVTTNRDSRKKVFLNRLRTKRDDARFDRNAEQILRMDWLKERKAWEHEMAQEIVQPDEYETEDQDTMMQEEDIDPAELSPTEEKELDELVSYYEQTQDDEFDDDEDYDAIFMEILSQQDRPETHAQPHTNDDVEMG